MWSLPRISQVCARCNHMSLNQRGRGIGVQKRWWDCGDKNVVLWEEGASSQGMKGLCRMGELRSLRKAHGPVSASMRGSDLQNLQRIHAFLATTLVALCYNSKRTLTPMINEDMSDTPMTGSWKATDSRGHWVLRRVHGFQKSTADFQKEI